MNSGRFLPLSVAIPSYRGEARLLNVIEKINGCDPVPSEILIHCDGGWKPDPCVFNESRTLVRLLHSEKKIGPGGGRDACIRAASHELVASFDDDSWPLDREYFAQALAIMEALPQVAILSPEVYLKEKPIQPQRAEASTSTYYQGSASIHRRSVHLTLPGFVPIPLAYGVEEADLSLQVHAAGHHILASPWLRAWHDRPLSDNNHQILPWIQNEILLVYLRYPIMAQPWGWWRAWRQAWRSRETLKVTILLRALAEAIPHCRAYQRYKQRYPLAQILNHLRMQPARFLLQQTSVGLQIFPSPS